jgi:hypothetical protein
MLAKQDSLMERINSLLVNMRRSLGNSSLQLAHLEVFLAMIVYNKLTLFKQGLDAGTDGGDAAGDGDEAEGDDVETDGGDNYCDREPSFAMDDVFEDRDAEGQAGVREREGEQWEAQ